MTQINSQDNTWQLSGDLVFATISEVLSESQDLAMPTQLTLDFANVDNIDTAGISFILELQRRAIANNAKISVTGLPESLVSLMQLYGVDNFIQYH